MRGRVRPGVVLDGTYRIVRLVGEGGMGEVYEARHARLAGRYAVKVLHSEIRKHPEVLLRFQREAQVTSALRHPGIVQVIDFNTAPNGAPYLVMEYLEGEDLEKIIGREGALGLRRAVDITSQIAGALSAAHRKGVVHRDLKPQNIFLLPAEDEQPERVKILDFGISKIRSVSRKLTGTAVVLGTPQFMAPEQAEGREDLDAAADQFSLAAIVYEMLTGRPAFSGDTLASVLYQIVHADPIPVTRIRPDLPGDIARVMARGLAKKRQDRYASASDFARALDEVARAAPYSGAGSPVTQVGHFASSSPSSGPAATVATAAALPAARDAPTLETPPSDSPHSETLPFGMMPELDTTTFGRTTGELFRLRRALGDRVGALVRLLTERPRFVAMLGSRNPRRALLVGAVTTALVIAAVVGFSGGSVSRQPPPAPVASQINGVRPTVQPLPASKGPSMAPSAELGASTVPVGSAPARRPESTGQADFELASDPPGLPVWVDDKPFPNAENQAVTRMRGSLLPGVHTFALTKPGFEPWRKQVDLKAGGPSRFVARMKKVEDPAAIFAALKATPVNDEPKVPGPPPVAASPAESCRATIGSTPWSRVWVDGKDTNRHTPVSLDLPCGVRQIGLRRPDLGIDFQTGVTLNSGEVFKRVYRIDAAK